LAVWPSSLFFATGRITSSRRFFHFGKLLGVEFGHFIGKFHRTQHFEDLRLVHDSGKPSIDITERLSETRIKDVLIKAKHGACYDNVS